MERQIEERRERLFRTMGDVGGDLIDTAEKRRFEMSLWRKWLPIAASLMLLVGLGLLVVPMFQSTAETEAVQTVETTEAAESTPEEMLQDSESGLENREPAADQQAAASGLERLVVQGMIYYVQAHYSAEHAELGTYLGTVTKADDPALVGAAVYGGGEPKEGQTLPLVIFVEYDGGYLYCLTYYAWDGPLFTAQDVREYWNIGKWDRLTQLFAVPELTFTEAGALSAEELVEFFLMTIQMEQKAGRRTEDLNRFLWSRQDVYVIPLEDVRAQLDRYLEGYVLEPEALTQYDRELDALILPSLQCTEKQVYLMPEQETSYDSENDVLTLVVSAYEEESGANRLFTRVYTIRFTEDRCCFESICERS